MYKYIIKSSISVLNEFENNESITWEQPKSEFWIFDENYHPDNTFFVWNIIQGGKSDAGITEIFARWYFWMNLFQASVNFAYWVPNGPESTSDGLYSLRTFSPKSN